MRDLILIAFIFGGLLLALRYPFTGLLLWAWFTLATPHQAAYAANTIPLNTIIAGVTFISFFLHGEFYKVRPTLLMVLMGSFAAWLWLSQLQSLDPQNSAPYFDRFIKVLIFIFLCMMVVTDKLRFHALLWLFAIVMGFYGAKGGLYTLLTFGQNIYYGLPESILYDNNHLGIALASTLPLFLYLQGQTTHPSVKWGIRLVFVLSIIAILGTHSRGAFVSLTIFAGFIWLRSQRKILLMCLGLLIATPTLVVLPENWFDRMSTIQDAENDESFMGRVDAWWINYKLAREHPLTGAGLRNPYEEDIAQQVDIFRTPRAAHSIYFEILGGAGFVGLFIYLYLLGEAFLTAWIAERKYRNANQHRWRSDFARHAQTSLAVFGVGAASVSLEMWEGYLLVIALISVLSGMVPASTSARSSIPHNRDKPEKPSLNLARNKSQSVPNNFA